MRTKSKLKMMRTDTDDGGADKKEKTTLLREITYLTRLIEQHDYKNKKASGLGMSLMESNVPRNKHVNIHQLNTSSTLYSSTSHKNKLNCTNIQTSSHHGLSLPASHSVFVNPKKLNRQLLEANSESIQKQNNFAAVDVPHRVYINPNFKKKESQTNKPVFKFVAGPVTSHITVGTTNKNICLNRGSEFGNKNIASQNIRNVLPTNINTNNPDMHRIRKSQEAPSNVNPGQLNKVFSYTKQSLSSSCLANISIDSHMNVVAQKPQILARKVVFQNSEAKAVQKSGSTNMSETLDGSKSLCNHSFGFKNRATISTEKAPTQKHEVPKKDSVAPEHYTNVCLLQESFRHSELDFGKKNVSETCKLKLNEIKVKKSSGLYESAQSQKMHDVKCHRRRSSSTCLVAVSKTKLVRKPKADINHTNTENSKVFPVQKKLKLLQPVNRYKLNKIGTLKVKNLIPNAYSVNNNPFSMVKLKPSAKAFHVKASCNRDKFKLVRLKPSVSSSGLSKFRLIVDQKKIKKAHCPVENVTLLESKLPSKSKGKNVIIKSKHFIVKNGFESATDIQGKKGIQLTKDGKNKWFSPVNTAMLMAKKTKLLRTSKFKNDISNKMRRTPPGSELMAVSRTKLIRKPISEIKRLQKLKTADCRHEIKLNPSVKLAHRVKNKYKFIKNVHAVRHIHLKQPQALQETPKMQRILKKRIASRILKKNCSLIKIGDSYYRASYNKLTRRTPGIARGNCGSIFKVQGRKYILHKGRQPLKYIRGTPLQLSKLKSSGGSVRSKIGTPNTPWSRLLQAKQRSIALLTNRLRKNNQPCLMFNRFGRCAGRDKGTCNKLHDPKNIAICKRFVQGCCENPSCLLSHNVGPEKMPTCHHFLAGNCVRENCPYLHVKLSKKAPVCLAFLQGYCADAANCYKRHEHICPEFEEKGVCPKGKYCPYPHPKEKNSHCRSSEQSRTSTDVCVKNSVEAKNSVEEDEEEIKNVVSSCRYFEEATADEFSLAECCEESVVEESTICTNDESPNYWINSRPKIGDLPGYIPLMNNSLDKIT